MDHTVLQRRISNAQNLMRQKGLDFLFVAPSSDLIYLFDYASHASERLAMLVVPQSGRPLMVVPTLERSRAADKEDIADIRTWNETDRPVDILREVTSSVNSPSIGVSEQMWSIFLLRMLESLPDAQFSSASEVIRDLRMVKDEAELDYLRTASSMADAAWEEFIKTVKLEGKTEREAAAALAELRKKHGLVVESNGICASGPHSAAPHHVTGDRVIQKGDAVIFDFGGHHHHYRADVTRTVHIGEPSDEYRKVYDIVLRANEAALEAYKPGNACQDVDRAARKLISDEGYGQYFIHRVGHGLGLDVHEEPYLVEGNTLPLQAGMVFSDEPGIYIEGRFGVRVEDSVVVTETGGVKINHATRDLVVME